MKKYKNIYLSVTFYIITILLAYLLPVLISLIFPKIASSAATPLEYLFFGGAILSVVVGIFFGLKSMKTKESEWIGHLMVVIGGFILASPLILYVLAFRV